MTRVAFLICKYVDMSYSSHVRALITFLVPLF